MTTLASEDLREIQAVRIRYSGKVCSDTSIEAPGEYAEWQDRSFDMKSHLMSIQVGQQLSNVLHLTEPRQSPERGQRCRRGFGILTRNSERLFVRRQLLISLVPISIFILVGAVGIAIGIDRIAIRIDHLEQLSNCGDAVIGSSVALQEKDRLPAREMFSADTQIAFAISEYLFCRVERKHE
jgi:hypothetical protein